MRKNTKKIVKTHTFLLFFTFFFLSLFPLWGLGSFQDDFSASQQRGKKIYANTCATCHQADGKGIVGVFPPLAQSDYLLQNSNRAIRQIRRGLQGKITVNGQVYNGVMPENTLKPQEIADIMNYINNAWGNKSPQIHTNTVIQALK
jgi:mono/diheme cytochrome c family protein